jgi:hypothetical protein
VTIHLFRNLHAVSTLSTYCHYLTINQREVLLNTFFIKLRWSTGGDSGALVFMRPSTENRLYPIGIHYQYQGSNGTIGNAIPLWTIFADFCAKNLSKGQKLNVVFKSPNLAKVCEFDPKNFLCCPYEYLEGSQY